MKNYHEHIKAQSKLYQLTVYGFMVLVVLWIFMNIWGYRYIAEYKAKNQKNIIEGCAFYGGDYKNKYKINNFYIYIDGKGRYLNYEIVAKKFPYTKKRKDFYNDFKGNYEKCNKIKYIELNLVLTRKIFIYDYVPN